MVRGKRSRNQGTEETRSAREVEAGGMRRVVGERDREREREREVGTKAACTVVHIKESS